ncbi:MAG: Phosphoribosylformylglycinamidine synthase 1 [Pseudomonadota bacterium]
MSRSVGVIRFPGTNCDRDVFEAVQMAGLKAEWLWHLDRFEAKKYRALVLPGGFSFGDYLRAGALAARSPVMDSVREAAKSGTPVLGICNGFQILCESHLLPGALVKNESLRFQDEWVDLTVVNAHKAFGSNLKSGASLKLPIAHGEGRFYASEAELKRLWDSGQVWLTYKHNPNGSLQNIAGVMSDDKNVVALMPHPERAMKAWMGSEDGQIIFKTLESIL